MTKQKHKKRHIVLHKMLDELTADWVANTEGLPSEHTIMELLKWSYQQTQNPTHKEK